MEVLKDVAAIIGCILSAASLITLLTKGGRAAIKRFFDRGTKTLKEENEKQSKDIAKIKADLETLLERFNAVEEVSRQ